MSEFNLSEKTILLGNSDEFNREIVFKEDVKEFIRWLKFYSYIELEHDTMTISYKLFHKLAGEKLI